MGYNDDGSDHFVQLNLSFERSINPANDHEK
jgi:hypothetical protein